MGRTLHYKVQTERPIPPEMWRVIRSVQTEMNEHFTWTSGNLQLEPVGEEERSQGYFVPDVPTNAPIQAYGFTTVIGDEWNAVLVVRFAKWLSMLLPQAKVRVTDEGDYVPCGDLVFEAGKVRLDSIRVQRRLAHLKYEGFRHKFQTLVQAAENALAHGAFWAKVPASAYVDRMELASLKTAENLSRVTPRMV